MTSNDHKIELDLELLLPHFSDENDQCIDKLEQSLRSTRGVAKIHVERKDDKLLLCLHYDPSLINISSLKRAAIQTGMSVSNRYQHVILPIAGMDCSDCTLVIEHSIKRMEGVLDASVSYVSGQLKLEYDSEKISRAQIQGRLRGLGYEMPETGFGAIVEERRELIFSLLCGTTIALAWVASKEQYSPFVTYLLYAAAYFFGAYDIARHAWHSLKERHFDTDLLMFLAATGAAILGEFAEGALLLFLFSLGHALEELALDKARDAVGKLGQLTPKTATVLRDSNTVEISVDELIVGDIAVIKPGVRIPVDGTVTKGSSAVDQSPITGESVPVEKTEGDSVFAGSINGNGQLLVKVSKLAKDNTLARVMQLVEESQAQKTKTQQLTDKFTSWFVPSVLAFDVLLIFAPMLFGVPLRTSFFRAMTFLVSVSPCALALAAPSAVLCGIAQAARNGVLVKGGIHLETLGQLKAIAFDKTGTLTHGRPRVTDTVQLDDLTEEQILSLTASCESRSGHPLAAAIVEEARSRKLEIFEPENMDSISGQGLIAKVQGKSIFIGNLKLMKERGVPLNDEQLEKLKSLEADGKTSIMVAVDSQIAGIIALADTARSNAAASLSRLHQLGIEQIFLLSGDNSRVATKLASELGIDHVKAELMPEDKVIAMKDIAQNKVIAMVGDGVNDAPALAAASVGIAMGGASTDVALETADVALMGDDLSKLPFAVSLGRATRRIILQNLVISIITIVCLAVASIAGFTNIGWAILFHEGSTLLVVVNALRLLGHRKELSLEKLKN